MTQRKINYKISLDKIFGKRDHYNITECLIGHEVALDFVEHLKHIVPEFDVVVTPTWIDDEDFPAFSLAFAPDDVTQIVEREWEVYVERGNVQNIIENYTY